MNEYDSYAQEIYRLLVSNVPQEDLVAHLRRIEVERMEVRGNPNMALSAIAAKLREVNETARTDQDADTG